MGTFGNDLPFGDATSIAITLGSAANMTLTPSGGTFSGNTSQTITIVSTDVVGYDLYINADTTTNLINGGGTIATSANSSPATLALNSWGYNTTGSTTNFKGITLSQVSIGGGSGYFYPTGDTTTVTYGAYIDSSKPSGTYTVDVTYTAIGQT